ncbi:MAG: hypothetical protein AAGD00_04585 [Planctomycetota bacterium]
MPVSTLHDLAAVMVLDFAPEQDDAQPTFSVEAAMVVAPEQLLEQEDFIEICCAFALLQEDFSPQETAL